MRRLLVLVVALGVSVAACGTPSPEVTALESAQTRWQAASIASYRYTIARFCFCPLVTQVVTVRNGEVVSVEAAPGSEGTRDGMTVDELFDELDQILGASQHGEVTADYDPDMGVPLTVSADPTVNAIDDEFSYTITDFVILTG
jgi:hypothetical protein